MSRHIQPVNLSLICLILCAACLSAFAQEFVWNQTAAPGTNWAAIASSSDGTKLLAAAASGGTYGSTNSGLQWFPMGAPSQAWHSVASSCDGTKLAAAGSGIYTSPDSGATWVQTSAPSTNWSSIACSADGTKLVAAVLGGGVYCSTDSGTNWTLTSALAPQNWRAVASSADGSLLIAAVGRNNGNYGGPLFTSGDFGTTWTQTTAPNAAFWQAVATSGDGTRLVAATLFGGIWCSTNSGANWTLANGTIGPSWSSVASSSDGTVLAAVAATGEIFRSADSGATWTPMSCPRLAWQSLAISADGLDLATASSDPSQAGAGIYSAGVKTYPPAIALQPVGVAACPGSTVILSVGATGTPPLVFRWRRNGTNLVDGGNILGAGTTNLALLSVSAADMASYDVVITNAFSSTTSCLAAVTVTTVPARATPIVANGFIIGATLLSGGCGYTNPPALVFSGQGGAGAAGYGQVWNGTVTNLIITSAGSGYPTNTVAAVAPPYGPNLTLAQFFTNAPSAAATPIIMNGFIIGAVLTFPGNGYTTNPAVWFSDSTGQGAGAYAQIAYGGVTNLVITNAGSGYSTGAVIHISPPPKIRVVAPNASNLMLGQNYQLQTTTDLNSWTGVGAPFTATIPTWVSTNYWSVADTNQLFFRLIMF